jgi:hypothetical protein
MEPCNWLVNKSIGEGFSGSLPMNPALEGSRRDRVFETLPDESGASLRLFDFPKGSVGIQILLVDAQE